MGYHRITRGLDLPIAGAPVGPVTDGPPVRHVAVVADDFPGLKPRLLVTVGDRVIRGQPLFEDRARPGVVHTSPGTGEVAAIHRGARRVLQSVVVSLSPGEVAGHPAPDELPRAAPGPPDPNAGAVRERMLRSGLWTAWRARPYHRVPPPDSRPDAVFVTAMDTNPLAPDPEAVLEGQESVLQLGLRVVSKLTEGTTYFCVAADSVIADRIDAPVSVERFAGPHPAGTAGLHIHRLAPVSRRRTVWTIGYQDVLAVGRLFGDGLLDVTRVVSVAGPSVSRPRLVRTRLGASVDDLVAEDAVGEGVRWIAGSVLSGKAVVSERLRFLGRYDVQLTALPEGRERSFLGWMAPGRRRFSTLPIFVSRFLRGPYEFTTNLQGSRRAMVPIGTYERVMPFDLVPTVLLRALAADDAERVEELGGLELAEEDLALCTFVDPGKADYGPMLRRVLDRLEQEG